MSDKTDALYTRMTETILVRMREAKAGDWSKPWLPAAGQLQRSAKTGKPYKGVNQWWLMTVAAERGYESGQWATYKDWEALGKQVSKKPKDWPKDLDYGTPGVKWGSFEKKDRKTGEKLRDEDGNVVLGWYERTFTLFAAEQTEGYVPEPKPERPQLERDAQADAYIKACNVAVRFQEGDRACYSPMADSITMPTPEQFHNSEGFYSTYLHELTHATGHESRANRQEEKRGNVFGNEGYAREELVAEIGACFAMAGLGMIAEPRPDHAQYLASWIQRLEDDKKEIYKAAKLAQRAVEWMDDQQETVPSEWADTRETVQ